VIGGWLLYFLAVIFAERAVWLGLTAILISSGNILAHVFIFNVRGKTIYNAGMATSLVLFAPCSYFFFSIVYGESLITKTDYAIGHTENKDGEARDYFNRSLALAPDFSLVKNNLNRLNGGKP
jgi:hypothetical protein